MPTVWRLCRNWALRFFWKSVQNRCCWAWQGGTVASGQWPVVSGEQGAVARRQREQPFCPRSALGRASGRQCSPAWVNSMYRVQPSTGRASTAGMHGARSCCPPTLSSDSATGQCNPLFPHRPRWRRPTPQQWRTGSTPKLWNIWQPSWSSRQGLAESVESRLLSALRTVHSQQQLQDQLDRLFYSVDWIRQAQPAVAAPATAGRWLLLADQQGVGKALAALLTAYGEQVHSL